MGGKYRPFNCRTLIKGGKGMKFTINSIKDKIQNAEVFGTDLQVAITEILHLNEHTYLSDTDWDIYDDDNVLIVEDGIEV